ncbi:17681_t:CDS:2, partial [Cetraspora pellucida]
MSMKASPEVSEQLEEYLKSKSIKSFDYSQFKDVKRIGEGGYAVVFSATFNEQIYALKSFNKNLKLEDKELGQFKREVKCLYKIEHHQNIIKFHGFSRAELDKLSTETTVEFITNPINSGNASTDLDSSAESSNKTDLSKKISTITIPKKSKTLDTDIDISSNDHAQSVNSFFENNIQQEEFTERDLQNVDDQIRQTSEIDWSDLIDMCEYGFIVEKGTIKKAPNKPFKIKLVDNRKFRLLNNHSEMKTHHDSSEYSSIIIKKAVLSISKPDIHLTENFIQDITNILSNNNMNDKTVQFRELSKKYGNFYASRFSFGGAIMTKNLKAKPKVAGFKGKIEIPFIKLTVNELSFPNNTEDEFASESYLVGGRGTNSDQNNWAESLEDFKTWQLIEHHDVYPLFNLLGKDLQEKLLEILGKRILKANVKELSFSLDKDQKTPYIYDLSEQLRDIPNIKDCQIFTSIMNEKDKYIFSSRIDYDDDNPIIVIHRIASKKAPNDRESYSIQLGWIVIGYPANFDVYFDFQKLPHQYARNKYIFGTCSLEVPKNSYSSHETTLVTGVYFVPQKRMGCLFIYDIDNNSDMNLLIDDLFLQRLMLNVCIIDCEPACSQKCYGKIDVNLNK